MIIINIYIYIYTDTAGEIRKVENTIITYVNNIS